MAPLAGMPVRDGRDGTDSSAAPSTLFPDREI